MATNSHPTNDPHGMDQILYSSLLILGLDAPSLEHSLRTPVNQNVFCQMNKKVGEALLHFLFTCIDRDKASKVFLDCWPILDKRQESQFHKATFEWYRSLQQGYGQPIPNAVAKTFLSPSGPKFTLALLTLTTVALHSTINKLVPEYTLLHFPVLSRNNPDQNRRKLMLLRASKIHHQKKFIRAERTRKHVLQTLRDRARSMIERYRNLCKEDEVNKEKLKLALHNDKRLNPQLKEKFLNSPLLEFQNEIHANITTLNSKAGEMWGRVNRFRDTALSSWRVLAPLLDGSVAQSHLDGSLYLPTVPEIIYSEHSANVNKMGLQGLYTEGKLNLLSLVQYSTLALQSLVTTVRNTHSLSKPESVEELKVLAGRTASTTETMNELSNKLNVLLPSLLESVYAHRQNSALTVTSLDNLDLEGKLDLCPPTPPLSLVNTPVNSKTRSKVDPLQLSLGNILVNKSKSHQIPTNCTPSKLLSSITMSRAAKRSPKADVVFSRATHLDDSVVIDTSDDTTLVEKEAGLTMEMITVDCRGTHQRNNEKKNRDLFSDSQEIPKSKKVFKPSKLSRIPKQRVGGSTNKSSVSCTNDKKKDTRNGVQHSTANGIPDVEDRESSAVDQESVTTKLTQDSISENGVENLASQEKEDSLIVALADILASSTDDDSGAFDLMTSSYFSNTTVIEASTGDSGCVADGLESEDTLIDAIGRIDITPKDKKKTRKDSLSIRRTIGSLNPCSVARKSLMSPLLISNGNTPVKRDNLQDSRSEYAQLIDVTPFQNTDKTLNVTDKLGKLSLQDPFKTPVPHKMDQGTEVRKYEDPGEELKINMLSNTEEVRSSNGDLLARLSSLMQSPARDNPTPLASKLRSKFEGVNFGRTAKPTNTSKDDIDFSSTVELLRHQTKTNLNKLMEHVNQVNLEYPNKVKKLKERRKTEVPSNRKFLSFVENIKHGKDSPSSILTDKNVKSNIVSDLGEKDYMTQPRPEVTETFSKEDYLSSLARMEQLFADDNDNTPTPTPTNDYRFIKKDMSSLMEENEAEETFFNAKDFEKTVLSAPDRRSSYLPQDAIFDTLTESIVAGETASSVLTEQEVQDEIRRESISSRRQSLMSLGRMSICSSKGLDELNAFQSRMSMDLNGNGLLDESDSCLLSISMDDIGEF